jgi:hypothetical protein
MAFTVSRNGGGTKDAEFEVYTRLLRRQGIDLGKSPRTPEPGTGRRWLYAWDSRKKAEAFAKELKRHTHDKSWGVDEVVAPLSVGPMGPLVIQVGRRSNGFVLGLHPSADAIIHSVFPDVRGTANTISVNFDVSQKFLNTHGSVEKLARELLPTLTGLKLEELEELGYVLIEDDTHRTLVFVRPGDLIQA